MIVGIDLHEAAPRLRPTGTGRVARELALRLPEAMPADDFLLYSRESFPLELPGNARWEIRGRRDPGWHRAIARHANRAADVFLSPTSYLPPQFLRIPYAQIVHDLVNRHWPATAKRKAIVIDRLAFRRAVRRAGVILTPSEAIRDELQAEFPERRPATVMYEGADRRFRPYPGEESTPVLRSYGIDGGYILCTGTIEPRKNLIRTIRAYERLPDAVRGRYDLVLAGRQGWRAGPTMDAISDSPARETIRHLSFVPDDDLPKLYSAATVLCYASLYEGFGLPVVEAMQSGTPVVCSDRSSLPEVGGDAVLYVDPESETSIEAGLAEVLGDAGLRDRYREAGLAQARRFSWERASGIVADELRRLEPAAVPVPT
jgi:glycosyltransferase involved in cell wall biosynthesis